MAEYYRTKGLSSAEIVKSRDFISKVLRDREKKITGAQISDTFINVAGIRMQSDAIKGIDPDTHHKGTHATVLQKEVVQEYLSNPVMIKAEAYDVIMKYYL